MKELKNKIASHKEQAFKDAFLKLDQEKLDEIFLITRYCPPENAGEKNTQQAEFHVNASLMQLPIENLSFGSEQFRLIGADQSVVLENAIFDRGYAIKLLSSHTFKKEEVDKARALQKNASSSEEKHAAHYLLVGIRDTCKYAEILTKKDLKEAGVSH